MSFKFYTERLLEKWCTDMQTKTSMHTCAPQASHTSLYCLFSSCLAIKPIKDDKSWIYIYGLIFSPNKI